MPMVASDMNRGINYFLKHLHFCIDNVEKEARNYASTVVVEGSGMAQLAERSLPIPEVRSSNPIDMTFYIEHVFTLKCIGKAIVKKKEAGNCRFFT